MRIVSTAIPAALPLALSRRHFALGAVALPLAAGACATTDVQRAERLLKIVIADAKLIASGLKGVLAQLAPLNIPGLTPEVLAAISTAISGTQGVAIALESVSSLASAQPLVQKIGTYVTAIVGTLATLPLPPDVLTALRAAVILLPVLETAVGLVANSLPETSEQEKARGALASVATG